MSTILGKNEKKIEEATFTANLLLFWLKASYTLTSKRITGETPNTFMGIFPVGKAQLAQPLKTIASVTNSTKFTFSRLFVGAILAIIGLAVIGSSFLLGLIVLGLGAVGVLNCYTATFVITNNAGISTGYEISILEQAKVVDFTNDVNTVLADL